MIGIFKCVDLSYNTRYNVDKHRGGSTNQMRVRHIIPLKFQCNLFQSFQFCT